MQIGGAEVTQKYVRLLPRRWTLCVVTRAGGIQLKNLRNTFQAIPSDSCVLEQVSFNTAGNRFRCSIRLLRFTVVIDIIRAEPIQFHVWSPEVVPGLKLVTQFGQMLIILDDRYPFEPFIFQGLDHSFRNRNRTVFS